LKLKATVTIKSPYNGDKKIKEEILAGYKEWIEHQLLDIFSQSFFRVEVEEDHGF